jgi:hypothetical protein
MDIIDISIKYQLFWFRKGEWESAICVSSRFKGSGVQRLGLGQSKDLEQGD